MEMLETEEVHEVDGPEDEEVVKSDEEREGRRCLRRAIKPVVRLTYDEPGVPTEEPLLIVHRGTGLND
ncbi:UNVERIFIED_CONTAM: hypothetical protein FKN15_043454 [Acipenser sinensis]